MPFENYAILLTVLAVIYSAVARFIQLKLVNKAEMDAVQSESKRLNDEYKAAEKANQKEKMERLMVTRCLECGCRVSWYSGGSVRIWGHGGGMVDVSEGKMIVSPGVEV